MNDQKKESVREKRKNALCDRLLQQDCNRLADRKVTTSRTKIWTG